jgi:hypothetical protein
MNIGYLIRRVDLFAVYKKVPDEVRNLILAYDAQTDKGTAFLNSHICGSNAVIFNSVSPGKFISDPIHYLNKIIIAAFHPEEDNYC